MKFLTSILFFAALTVPTFAWPPQPEYLSDIEVIKTVTRDRMTTQEIVDTLDRAPNVKSVSRWMAPANRMRMFLETLAYPQYADNYALSESEWAELQAFCKKELEESKGYAHPDVIKHWESIVAGTPPFGLRVSKTKKDRP